MSIKESDEWLMGQVIRGRREYLEPLVRRYANPILTYIQRMVGDRHRGEELFQEVFLSVWSKRRQYKVDAPFRSWLFAIAANKCKEEFRRRGRQTEASASPEIGIPTGEPGPVATAIQAETAALVAQATQQLPHQQRAVVVLRIWNGLSYAEIASIVGRAEATVRANMHHALKSLRKQLDSMVNR